MPTQTTTDEYVRGVLTGSWPPGVTAFRAGAAQLASADPCVDDRGIATDVLREALLGVWEKGWQPADVVHVVGRDTSPRNRRLLLALISADAEAARAEQRAPAEWLDQLRSLGVLDDAAPRGVHAWHVSEKRPAVEAWEAVLHVADRLRPLFPLPVLLPPPSRWGGAPSQPTLGGDASTPEGTARVLRRIRNLLAKAESTEFPEEADALTAKAQELMSAHAVDAGMLDAERDDDLHAGVRSRRLHVEEPYVEVKMMLLSQVGGANGVRTAWYRNLGIATCVGMAVDLEIVELLFTSLLIQATRAMNTAGARDATARSAAFRRSFLLSYGSRIGERLAAVRSHATQEAAAARGVDALPVLRGRQEAVDATYAKLFPGVRARRSQAFDSAGWFAGRRAADQADLTRRRGRLPR